MTRSLLRFAGMESIFQRQRRHAQRRRRKPLPLAVQSLEPRLALAVGVAGGFERAATPPADTAPPAIQSITAPKAQTYGEGRTIVFRVNFNERVVATGVPTLPITIGDTVRQTVWNGKGSGSKSLVFTTVVQAGDLAPAGVQVAGPITFPDGAAIRDRAGNDLNPAASGAFPKARVDAVGPSVNDFGPIAVAGRRVSILVTFTEPVTVGGKPSIPFTLDGAPRELVYARGSGSNVLFFQYRATRRETPTVENVAVSAPALTFSRERIVDRAGNVAASLARPTDIALSATSIAENAGANAVVGTLSTVDPDAGNTFTYTLVSGTGSTDNAAFNISGNQLRTTASLDFETKSSYSVRVRSTDQGGLSTEKQFTLTVTNVNEAPTDIALSATSIAENAGANAVVGTLSTVDPDAGNTFTYTLVSGTGSTDNTAFNISGNQLRASASLDFETKSSYSVRVRSTDQGGLSTGKQFTITVTDLAVEMAFVTVGDAGNAADSTGYGSVGYEYRIGKYEVTIGQYTQFLNAVAKTDTYELYNTWMADLPSVAGIARSGVSGAYSYNAIPPSGIAPAGAGSADNRPVAMVSWFSAARFANWMHNGQPTGLQDASTTEGGAYTLNGAVTGNAMAKNAGAKFYIPTENEWYKAAYYSPMLKSGVGGYYAYATQSNSAPGNMIGSGANQANYRLNDIYAVTQSASYSLSQNYLTDVGAFTNSASYYGTFDQSGNVMEWNDLDGSPSATRGWRGSYSLSSIVGDLSSSYRLTLPAHALDGSGFRLARPASGF